MSGTNQTTLNSFQTCSLHALLLSQIERWAGQTVGPECVGIFRAQFRYGFGESLFECCPILAVRLRQLPQQTDHLTITFEPASGNTLHRFNQTDDANDRRWVDAFTQCFVVEAHIAACYGCFKCSAGLSHPI